MRARGGKHKLRKDEHVRSGDRTHDEESAGDDFAEEHKSTTFADQLKGGPEKRREPESPTGRGGDGGMDP